MDFTEIERERIIKDIINHAIEEEEIGAGGYFSPQDIDELRETLEDKSDDDLYNWWDSNVSEWIAPMDRWGDDEYQTENGVPKWEANGFENVIEWQFYKLCSEGKTDYGYIHPEYHQPY